MAMNLCELLSQRVDEEHWVGQTGSLGPPKAPHMEGS